MNRYQMINRIVNVAAMVFIILGVCLMIEHWFFVDVSPLHWIADRWGNIILAFLLIIVIDVIAVALLLFNAWMREKSKQ